MSNQNEISAAAVQAGVREYYGQTLQSSADLRTSACCSADAMPEYLRTLLAQLHPQVRERFYGCGSPIPAALDGACVLDLGCGSGRDVYMLSQLVGDSGRVIGVDMTAEQIDVAQRHREFHAQAFGHAQSNVELKQGDLADLGALGIADASVDVVVSNCVLNLVTDKTRAFTEIVRVLKPGGELYFSDVFADRRLPPELMADTELVGECLAGAMYIEDFRRLLARLGVDDARICARSPIALTDAAINQRIGFAGFESITWRAFKLDLEARGEDYGQTATYLGTMEHYPQAFELDAQNHLESGHALHVSGNTAAMLSATRYARHFRIDGDKRMHLGLFERAPAPVRTCKDATSGCC